MKNILAVEPLFVPKDCRDAAVAVLDSLSRARIVTELALLTFARAEGLEAEVLDHWIAAALVARTVIVSDPVRDERTPVLALTPKGARSLSAVTGNTVRAIPPSRLRRSNQKLLHDAGIGDVALAFITLARTSKIDLAAIDTDDEHLATSAVVHERGKPERVALQADAYAIVRGARALQGLLIEFDRGTITPKKMQKKYLAYAAWRASGGPERAFQVRAMRLLTIVPDERREERLHAAALDANGGKRSGFFLFARASDLSVRDPERMLGPVVRQLGDSARTPLFIAL